MQEIKPRLGVLGWFWFYLPTCVQVWGTNAQKVVLQDWRGDLYETLAWSISGDNDLLICWVFCRTRIGLIYLRADGRIQSINGSLHYIDYWLPKNRKARICMILQGAHGFEIPESWIDQIKNRVTILFNFWRY